MSYKENESVMNSTPHLQCCSNTSLSIYLISVLSTVKRERFLLFQQSSKINLSRRKNNFDQIDDDRWIWENGWQTRREIQYRKFIKNLMNACT